MTPKGPIIIGITGGIGSGKSTVSRILRIHGLPVYDCDINAKRLMELSRELHELLHTRIGDEAHLADGGINRPVLARQLFTDRDLRAEVERIVHADVAEDFHNWCKSMPSAKIFIESAILKTSGLDKLCDEIWIVQAPDEVRIERVRERSGLTRQQIVERMEAQRCEFDLPPEKAKVIINDGVEPLLAQINHLIGQ